MNLPKLISVAKGEETADLILKNAKIINTFTAEIEDGNVAISQGYIAGVGDYQQGKEIVDLNGKFLAPGLIDGHIHLESSFLHPLEYARAVVSRGVLAVVSDLHEIANVAGLQGIKYLSESLRDLPLDLRLMAPSCVPATHLETSGATLRTEELRQVMELEETIGLGEMMNFPGVIFGDPDVLAKIKLFQGKPIDGHSPRLSGKELNAYLSAGIDSEHEATSYEEGKEKLRKGMFLMIREGSSEKNLEALLPLVNDNTYKRCLFMVDDRTCFDLLRDGDVDAVVRKAIKLGLDPIRAIQLATINPADYFRLRHLGAVAPGRLANLIVLSDLDELKVETVFYRGKIVAKVGKPLFSASLNVPKELAHTVKIKPFEVESLRLKVKGETFPVIKIIPDQIVTERVDEEVKVDENGFVVSDTEKDILKLVVVERHLETGNIGKGLVKGFGLRKGALGSSIAHDSHNIVVVGTNDEDIYVAVKEIENLQGGLVVVAGGKILGSLALPVAGLLSELPLEKVVAKLEELHRIVSDLGCILKSPFATLSFLALPVIPELKLTDKGLVDVVNFKLLDLE